MRLSPPFYFTFILLLTFSLSSCSTFSRFIPGGKKNKADDEKADTVKRERFIGLIELANPEQHFVLIRTEGNIALAPGTKLETRPQIGASTVLVVTPERKQSFISADVSHGFPQRGQPVVLPISSQADDAPSPFLPTSPNQLTPEVPPIYNGAPTADGLPVPGSIPSPQDLLTPLPTQPSSHTDLQPLPTE